MPVDTTSVFYKIGQGVASQIDNNNASFLSSTNTFTGAQTFSGGVAINTSNLTVDATATSTFSGGVTIQTNALSVTSASTFSGGVTINTSALDVNAGATISTLQVEDLTAGRVVIAGASGEIQDDANLTFDSTSQTLTTVNGAFGGNIVVTGNLTVQGTTTTLDSDNLSVKDNLIILNNGAADVSTEANTAGFLFERADGTENAALVFNETGDRFELGLDSGTGQASTLGTVSLGGLAVNELFIGTRAETQPLGDLADFTAGLNA